MNKAKKVLVGSLLLTTLLSTTSMTQADGFLKKVFGGSGSGASFKSMLSHVPADTSYLFTNQKPIPSDVMDFHLKRSQEMFKMLSKLQYKAEKESDGKDKDKEVNKGEAFFKAITEEFSAKLADKKFEETGLSLKATSMIYGYNEMPVIRLSIADKEKIMELIKRAEEESGYKVKFDKCGEFECIKESLGANAPSVAVVVLKNQLALAMFVKEDEKDVINHLIGKADPKKTYKEDTWEAFLKDNGYKGFGDGFINIKKLYKNHKEDIAKELFKTRPSSKAEITEKDIKACTGVLDDHINNMPGIIFGTKSLNKNITDAEMVLQTSESVSGILAGLANKTNIAKQSADPILSFGVNVDFNKMNEAMTSYSKFLIKSGEDNKCTLLKPADIRKSVGGLMMVMNMGLTQFKSIYIALNDIELDKKMKPKKLDVLVSLGSDDPAGILAMGAMMAPGLAKLKVPEDGSPVKLPAGIIPSKGMPLPPLSISRTDKSVNIMVGNDKPKLIDYKGEKEEMMTFALDGKRYYEILGSIMKGIPQSKSGPDVAEIMTSMGGMMGKIKEEVSADKRGLVVDYHISY